MTFVALDEEERPRKRKRKRAPDEGGAKIDAEPLAAAPEAPATPLVEPSRFLRSFPSDDALVPLVAAFERGDYAFVRVEAPLLAARTKDEQVRRAALELRRRIDPDRLSLLLVGFAFALLVVLATFYWTNKHP